MSSPSTNSRQDSQTLIFWRTIFFFLEATLAINGMASFFLFLTGQFLHRTAAEVVLGYLPFAGISLVPIIGGVVMKGPWRHLFHAHLHMTVIAGQIYALLPLPHLGTPDYVGITCVLVLLAGFVFKIFRHLEEGIDGKSDDRLLQALCSCFGRRDGKVEEVELEQQYAVEEGRLTDHSLLKPPSYELPDWVKEKPGAEHQALLKDADSV